MLKFAKQLKTLRITSKKIMEVFAADPRANLDEKKCSYGSIYKEMELEMDCLMSRINLQKVFEACVSSSLWSIKFIDGWAKY